MKTIYRIAKTELSTLFFSPVAWVVLVIFLVQSGWEFFSFVERFEKGQQMGTLGNYSLTESIFTGFRGVFTDMQSYLYLYVPLLTMGLVSRELSSGSIKLLLSSPIKVSEIILGKYLAIVAYCLLLMTLLGFSVITACFFVEALDVRFLLSGLLGLYLLICTYAAIGLFMSCLTSYQVIAAISTLVVLAGLNFIGKLWQGVEFVRDITYFLSISGRADQMINGLITSKDILYFVIVMALFVGLSILKLQSGRESKPWFVKAGKYALLVCIALLTGYITSKPKLTLYHDMTLTKRRTLTQQSQEVVKQIKGPIKMTTYVNLLDEYYYYGLPRSKNQDISAFEQYQRFLPELEMEYVYYYDTSQNERLYKQNPGLNDDELVKKILKSEDLKLKGLLSPAGIKDVIDLAPEKNRLVRQIEYKGKKTFLRMFDDLYKYPFEKEITAAMKRLLVTPPKVAFITGNMERSVLKEGDGDYKTATTEIAFRYALVNQGFDIVTVKPGENIPEDVAVLVVSDPKRELDNGELNNIRTYIKKGGNLMVMGEPGRAHVLNAIVEPLGIGFTNNILLQESEDYSPDLLWANVSSEAGDLSKVFGGIYKKEGKISVPRGMGIVVHDPGAFKATPTLTTNGQGIWNAPADTDLTDPETLKTLKSDAETDTVPLAMALTRSHAGGEQRIMIIGDADFMSNAELRRNNIRTSNFEFMNAIFNWFSNGEFPVDTSRPEPRDTKILVNAGQLFYAKIGFIGMLPALIIFFGAFTLIKRNRR